MKKIDFLPIDFLPIDFLPLAFLLLTAAGCTQEDSVNREPKHTVISAVMEEPSDTRSHATDEGKFTWSKGDKISVYTSSGNFRTFTLQGEGGTAVSNFTGTLVDGEDITQCAVYPNYGNHKVNGNTLTFNLPAEYGDFKTEYVANTNAAMIALTDNSTDFNFKHISGVLRFKLDNIPAGSAQFVFTAKDKDITGDFTVDLSAATPTIAAREKTTANSITIKFKPLESAQNDMTFFVPLPIGTYNGFTIAMKMQDGTLLVDYENKSSNTLKRKSLARFPKLKFADVSGSMIIYDLGLPSGLLWSKINVGASSPTDFGEYCLMSDDKDVATERMGDGFSTPTKEQFEELIAFTSQSHIEIDGVKGMLFEGQNGSSIFLPAAAQLWWDDEEGEGVWSVNGANSGAYWTRTPSEYEGYAYFLEFNDEENEPFFGDRKTKTNKLPIRPVFKPE